MSKPIANAENRLAAVRERLKVIQVTRLAGQKMEGHDIPKEDIAWIKKMTGNYKKWRTLRSRIRKLTDEERKLLDLEEEKLIQKTESLRKYFSKKTA